MSKLKRMIPFFIVMIIDYYVLPMLIEDTGSGMLMLIYIIPTICMITSFIYGIQKIFSWGYPLIITIGFIPSIFIFYNSSAWGYIIAYGIGAFGACAMGRLLGKVVRREIFNIK